MACGRVKSGVARYNDGVLGHGKPPALVFNMDSIMESNILRYESPEKYYGVLNDCELFDTNVDGWRIYERCHPDHLEMSGLLPEGVRCYSVVLETDVSTQAQLQARHKDVFKLTDELDRVWTYAADYPLKATHSRSVYGEGPERWQTNYKDVDRAIERARSHSRFIIEGEWSLELMQSILLPTWPLKRALNILEQYRSTSVATRFLIELHYQSLTSRDTASQLLFLAKTLELVESLLPDPKRKSDSKQKRAFKQKHLPEAVTRALEYGQDTLHKLFDIANNKQETRHIKYNPKTASLPPQITADERRSFLHNADLIIRGVVALQFGIEPIILKVQP
jgi:hypothetical protein